MIIATVALFVSLAGVGYAATELPANSVGRNQIQNGAVNYQKISPRSVGIVRINPSTVQARVLDTCNPGGSEAAIAAIDAHGRPTCSGTRPKEYDASTGSPVSVSSGLTPIVGVALPRGPWYLALSTPYVQISGTAATDQQVTVTCRIDTSPLDDSSPIRTAAFNLSSGHETAGGPIPLTLAVTANSTTDTETVDCSQTVTGAGAAPLVQATATINAIETGENTTEPSTTTTTR